MIKLEKRMNRKPKLKRVAAVEYKIYRYASQQAKRAAPAALWGQRACPAPTGEPCPIHSTLNPGLFPVFMAPLCIALVSIFTWSLILTHLCN